ncbi:MAG: ubiquinol-cytochrome C chaperone family protein [Alphaproteobacteria bacterium]|jgi:cytochrome b pre-mRNA-processing protein 3|nr:ubiquinol-cytochrome C chaperone family protein [Alphaproteobacteria bacterium]MBN9576763.1 ubiquinol-cytochrome C chaperone family protein [Alphaproteobacteria bacterium]
MLKLLARNRKAQTEARAQAGRLHAAIAAAARVPQFYTALGVADSLDGRFDMVALHSWLVLERLEALGARDQAQALTNILFDGFDEGLRELGAGDMGMGRKMRKLANAFYGRMQVYRDAPDEAAMAEAIWRNIYRGDEGMRPAAQTLARYTVAARGRIAGQDLRTALPDFGAPC